MQSGASLVQTPPQSYRPVVASARDAEAVMDEVAFLESALRGAVDRRVCQTAPCLAPSLESAQKQKFDAEVVAYGVKLREWIDLQVDGRLREVLPGLVEEELAAARQDGAAAVASVERLGSEMGALAEAQSKLLLLVDGISQEVGRVKAAATSCQLNANMSTALQGSSHAANEEALASVEKLMGTVEELKRSIRQDETTAAAQLAKHEAQLAELWKWQERHEGTVCSLQRCHEDAQLPAMRKWHEGHQSAINELQHAHRELMKSCDAVKGHQEHVVGLSKQVQDLDARINMVRTELVSRVSDEIQAVASSSKAECRGLAELTSASRTEFEAKVGARLEQLTHEVGSCASQTDVISLAEESRMNFKAVQTGQARFEESLKSDLKRHVDELHSEMTLAFKSEATAVAALDELLWLTDQRLGQRIDELAHLHLGAKASAAVDRHGFAEQHNSSLEDSKELRERSRPQSVQNSPLAQRQQMLVQMQQMQMQLEQMQQGHVGLSPQQQQLLHQKHEVQSPTEPVAAGGSALRRSNGAVSRISVSRCGDASAMAAATAAEEGHRRSFEVDSHLAMRNELSGASLVSEIYQTSDEPLGQRRLSPKSPRSHRGSGISMATVAAEELHERGTANDSRATAQPSSAVEAILHVHSAPSNGHYQGVVERGEWVGAEGTVLRDQFKFGRRASSPPMALGSD